MNPRQMAEKRVTLSGRLHKRLPVTFLAPFLAAFMVWILPLQSYAQARNIPRFVGTTWSGFNSPLFGTLFTQITPENAGKWGLVEPRPGVFHWQALDAMYKLARRRHLIIKQHNMIWGQQQPAWVNNGNARKAVIAWFAAFARRYGSRTALMDVVNEPLQHPPAYRAGLPGGSSRWGWVVWTYQLARKYFPHTKLLINDYNILNSVRNTQRYARLIHILLQKHLIDGIGCQAHGLERTPSSLIRRNLRTLAALDIPIYISEYDLNWKSDALQLAQMKRQFPIFWNDPHVAGITFWDFKQGHTWLPYTYLVKRNGRPRPALAWLRHYLHQ